MKRTINNLLAKFNIRLIKLDKSNSLESFLLFLIKYKVNINFVYDIGAYKGEWTNTVKKYLSNARFYLFEPNSIHNYELAKTNFPYFNLFLGESEKKITFWSANATGDTKYPEFNPILKPKSLQQVTLDYIVNKNNLPLPEFIKLDTQGSELDILQGATHAIQDCKVMILETPILKYNSGAPNQIDYLKFMKNIGMIPVWVTDIHRQKETAIQMDFAFFRMDLYEEKIGSISNIPFWCQF